jgi:hypothetical protein
MFASKQNLRTIISKEFGIWSLVSGLSSNWVLNSQEFLVISSAWISLPHRKIIISKYLTHPSLQVKLFSVLLSSSSSLSPKVAWSRCVKVPQSPKTRSKVLASIHKKPLLSRRPFSSTQAFLAVLNQDPARHQILPFASDFVVEDLVWRLSHLDHPFTLLGWLCQCSISHTFACPVFVWTQHGTCRHVHASITSPILSSLTI